MGFLWSGSAGLAALCLLAAGQAGDKAYGPFTLTSPLETVQAVGVPATDPDARAIGGLTPLRAITGFAPVVAAGTALGVPAGYSPATLWLACPLITVLMRVPRIAWIADDDPVRRVRRDRAHRDPDLRAACGLSGRGAASPRTIVPSTGWPQPSARGWRGAS